MSSNNSSSGGIGFAGLLTIVFIVLKLTNFISWSWWWVLAPIWISFGLGLAALIIFGIVILVIAIADTRTTKPQKKSIPNRRRTLDRW